ncbi:hypothetical protein SLS54_006088 [Diplodia seriata]
MADIQNWMRKTIQPVRTRTPTFPLTSEERRSTVDASSLSENSTPRRRSGPRKKISSYFSHRPNKYFDGPTTEIWSPGGTTNDTPSPDISTMIDAIFIKLCNQPFDGLPEQMNSSILHVIEAYRNLNVEKEQLDERLEEMSSRLDEAQKTWEKEERDFRAEIKRLELIIAKGKNGMSRLMASRQDSVVNRKKSYRTQAGLSTPATRGVETVTKQEPRTKDSQHGKPLPIGSVLETNAERKSSLATSPSSKERALSIQFFSTVNNDILVGTPPLENVSNALGNVSAFPGVPKTSSSQGQQSIPDDKSALRGSRAALNPSGDIVPCDQKEIRTFAENDLARDFQAIKQMASAIATNRGLRAEQVLPRLVELFDNAEEHLEVPSMEAVQRTPTGPQMRRPPSWMPNDDSAGWKDSHTIPAIRPPLRTIDSFASSHGEAMSDLSASSSEECGGERNVRRPSKIPSPTHDKGLARSRQEQRSSVVTVVGGAGRSEAEMLSSSASSRRTAFRNSAERLDANGNNMLRQMSQTSSRRSLSASAAQGGATSSPDAAAAKSTTAIPK